MLLYHLSITRAKCMGLLDRCYNCHLVPGLGDNLQRTTMLYSIVLRVKYPSNMLGNA